MNLTLKDIFISLWKNIFLIISAALIGLLIFWGFTYFFIKPTYTSTAKLYVYNEKTDERYITQSDLTVSKSLVDTYLIIVNSTPVLEEVAEKLQARYPDITAKDVGDMLEGSAINETEAFYISATDTDRQKATDVVNTLIDIVPDEIIRIVKAASVEVIEKAYLPEKDDYEWALIQNSVIGFVLGLLLSAIYIIAANMLDTTIYGKNEVANNFKIPIIGAIPCQFDTKRKKRKLLSKKSTLDTEGIRQSFILDKSTAFAISEAYRMARTNIFYLPIEDNCRKIAISSSIEAEGKSFCSINITKILAQAGKKVLLIDADMRKPRIGRYLKMDKGDGLSEFLAGITEEIKIVHNEDIGADVILSGNTSSSAAELLATSRINKIFEMAEEKYDYVIIDTPPINVVTDATALSDKINGYIVTMRAGISDVEQTKEMVHSLEQLEAKILGTIITNIEPKMESYGKYNRYNKYKRYAYYGKKYGYEN